jgi:hypothetical protein
MDNSKKVYRKSGVTIACYVFAVFLLIYMCYTAGNTVGQINDYYAQYAQYGISATPMDYITLILQNSLPYLIYTVVVFMLGYILDAVRKTDPKNYMTEEEYQDAKAAKKEAKEAKKIAKCEKKAAAKAIKEQEETSVAEDFANDLDKELKAEEKKDEYKKSSSNNGYKRNYNQNKNGNNGHRNYNNRPGGNRNNNGNRRNNNQNGNQNHNSNNNNQSKQVAEEKKAEDIQNKAVESKEKTSDFFEAKVFEEK